MIFLKGLMDNIYLAFNVRLSTAGSNVFYMVYGSFISSKHGLRTQSDTSVSFMINPSVQIRAFESPRNYRKGKIYVFGPRLVADFHSNG